MKLIKPYFEILEQAPGIEGLNKHIELCGRNAYKSEDKITEDSAKAFVDKICKAKHGSVLEHGTVYLKILWEYKNYMDFEFSEIFYNLNKYSICKRELRKEDLCPTLYITTNYRVLKENNRLKDLKYICEPTEKHEKRVSVRFVCSRAISHELVRHRTFSATMESQRYCNYSKDKFDNNITFIEPLWFKYPQLDIENSVAEKSDKNGAVFYERAYKTYYFENATTEYDRFGYDWHVEDFFIHSCQTAESCYKLMLEKGCSPQEAREVLPNSTKTDIIMTGFISDWKHFFELRTTENVHPEMRRLTIPLQEEFKKRGYIDD